MYSKRVWLNEENSPSTGSVVAFDGFVRNDKEEWNLERADNHGRCYAYVYNADHPELSEYGEVQIVSANGGLMRIA